MTEKDALNGTGGPTTSSQRMTDTPGSANPVETHPEDDNCMIYL